MKRAAPISDLLLPADLERGLGLRLLGRRVIYQRRIDSTNDLARYLARSGEPEGTVVIAEAQTAGRGRRGRSWLSSPGAGLVFSLVLRPALPPGRAGRLNLLVACAVAAGLEEVSGLTVGLKWPNDFIVAGGKAGGMLIEGSLAGGGADYLVVGIGVNVNDAAFPPELASRAVSLRQAAGRSFVRREVLLSVLARLEEYYLDPAWRKDFSRLLDFYRAHSTILDREVTVLGSGGGYAARVLDVTENGELVVRNGEGATKKLWSEEVSVRPDTGIDDKDDKLVS